MVRAAIFGIIGILMTCIMIGCSTAKQPLTTVKKVDLDRYLGLWYEIARFENDFQENCTATTANYEKIDDEYIKVTNRCRMYNTSGELSQAIGKAWVVDEITNAKLKVTFFWPFKGDYWIIDLDEQNYSYAVVGTPGRDYLWILSRAPEMDHSLFRRIVKRVKKKGYDVNKIVKYPNVEQSPPEKEREE